MTRLVLLPGLDGSGALFSGFTSILPESIHAEVVALPSTLCGYNALAEFVGPRLHLDSSTILLAESYSGPLAVLLAGRFPVGGLVLCNSFVVRPRAWLLGALARPFLGMTPPRFVVRRFLTGRHAKDDVIDRFREALRSIPARVLAERMKNVFEVDVTATLAAYTGRLLYLRGREDLLVGKASLRSVQRVAPRTQVIQVPGPHLLLQTRPETSWQAIAPVIAGWAEA